MGWHLPKLRSGGYRNADGPGGKRVIVSDPDAAPMITELFERFATGQYSLKASGEGTQRRRPQVARAQALQQCRSPNPEKAVVLRAISTGTAGRTQARTSRWPRRECWQRVQELLDARAENKTRKVKHDFAYTGLVHCGHCGCLLVGELKKGKYVYYHCTGNRGKCPEPYTRQEILAAISPNVLQELVIPQPSSNGSAMLCSTPTGRSRRLAQQTIKTLQARHEQIEARIETMYMDKLDGRITQEFFDKHSADVARMSRRRCCARSRTSRRPRRHRSIRRSTCCG